MRNLIQTNEGVLKGNAEDKTDIVREIKEFYTMRCRGSTKMETKWSLVSIAIVRNMESTSNIIDLTGKSAHGALVSIVCAIRYLCAHAGACRGRTSEKVCYSHTCPNTDFLSGRTVMCWAVLSRKFTPVMFLDRFAVLAIKQLYQHILEAWRTCSEARGCLFGDRNIMTFWLERACLSWSVNTAHQSSYLIYIIYIYVVRVGNLG